MNILNRATEYTINEYKDGIHRHNDAIKVVSANGDVYNINRGYNNLFEISFEIIQDSRCVDFRASKALIIAYLIRN